jgi:hypothetical protein
MPVWSSHGGVGPVGWADVVAPRHPFVEQVWQHALTRADDGYHRFSLANPALGFGVEMSARADTLPHLLQWQAYGSGLYALGIEPATHGVDPRGADVVLRPEEERTFEVRVAVRAD